MRDLVTALAGWAWEASLHAAVLVVLVLAAQSLLYGVMSPGWRYALSLLVLMRLLLPVAPESGFSISNLAPAGPVQAPPAETAPDPLTERFLTPADDNASLAADDGMVTNGRERAGSAGRDDALAMPLKSLSATEVMSWIWLLGVLAVLFWSAAEHLRLMRWLRRWGHPADDELIDLFARCGGRGVQLLEVPGLQTAAAVGVFRPRVILPEGFRATLEVEEIEDIFAHELAHLRKGDLAMNWLVVLAGALHWFNPLAWIGLRRLLTEREIARDAFVVRGGGASRRTRYGKTLLKVVETFQPTRLSPGAAPIFTYQPEIRKRITMIANTRWNSRLAGLFSLLLAATFTVATFTSARADDDDKEPQRQQRERESDDRERGEPDRERGEPDRERGEPDRERGEPDRERGEPERERGEPERERGEPERERGEPDRERDEPDRERDEPDREQDEPDRERGERDRERDEPDRERGEPERERGEPERERGEPDRERGEPDRERGEPERERGEPDRERDEPDRERGEPDRERGEPERERGEREGEEGERSRESGEFERHIDELRAALEQARERGQLDRAEGLERRLRAALERGAEGRGERPAQNRPGGERAERHFEELRAAIENAREHGQLDRAEALERRLEAALKGRDERQEIAEREAAQRRRQAERGGDDFERKLDRARERVRELAELGRIEEAENLEREIEQAMRQRRERAERAERAERERPDGEGAERERREREPASAERTEALEHRLREMAKRIEQLEGELQKLRERDR